MTGFPVPGLCSLVYAPTQQVIIENRCFLTFTRVGVVKKAINQNQGRKKNGNSESRSRWIPIFISIHGDTYLYGERSIYERLRRSLYVLATSVSAPKRKVWIFQSYVVRDVTYVRSIRYHSFWCSMIHFRIMSR